MGLARDAVSEVVASGNSMPEKPILIFPTPTIAARTSRTGRGKPIVAPTAAQQSQRLDQKFQTIANSFQQVQAGMAGLNPEQVIILEAIGKLTDLAKAAVRVPGLEWLTEVDLEETPPVAGFQVADEPDKLLPQRLFALMSNQQAMNDLLGLWRRWCQHPAERARQGFGPFKQVFVHLKDVRLWGPKDRVDPATIAAWQEAVQHQQDPIRFQTELWCRQRENVRQAAYGALNDLVTAAGGRCIAQRAIPEIGYHGVLVDLPKAEIQKTIIRIQDQTYTALLRANGVMLFRPMAQMAAPILADARTSLPAGFGNGRPEPAGDPVVAVLDGHPLPTHTALDGRLQIDDPDGFSDQYQASEQQHGTAMVSLVVHGDLSSASEPLPQPVYIRPILLPSRDPISNSAMEIMPDDQLPLDLLERAVRRIAEGDGHEPAAAPTVRVVNLSLGDASLPFDRDPSPLSRLLDWLSWKYRLLFVVSAGNQTQDIVLNCRYGDSDRLTPEQKTALSMQALFADQVNRRLYAPAESTNAITVGVAHADRSGNPNPGRLHDLIPGRRWPSPITTISGGYRRAVKPEILMEGGRQLYVSKVAGQQTAFEVSRATAAPGQLVAVPGNAPGERNRVMFSRGTSNATALATRHAALIHSRLSLLAAEPGGERLLSDPFAVTMIKALLVHGASWPDTDGPPDPFAGITLDWRAKQDLVTRLVGYGEVDVERAIAGNEQRVVLVGCEAIADGQGHEYYLPLPPSLGSVNYRRRLTITLAWLSPVNHRHRDYRQAFLWVDTPAEYLSTGLGVNARDVDRPASTRGTVQHLVFEGADAIPFADNAHLTIKVNCRGDAGGFQGTVSYGLAVTLEVAAPIPIDIHTEIQDRVRARARIAALPR
jgi:hypothetical protein